MTFKLADNEKWIAGYEDMYSVDTDGNVWSYRRQNRRKLNQHINIKDYPCVSLRNSDGGKAFTVHRLVADMFIPNPNGYKLLKHKDLNRGNNSVGNLEWVADISELYSYWDKQKAIGRNTYELFQTANVSKKAKETRAAADKAVRDYCDRVSGKQ